MDIVKKKPIGRPKLKLEDKLPENWKDIVYDMMKVGKSQVAVMAHFGLNADTYYSILKRDKEFSDTIKRGMDLCQAWWEEKGRDAIESNRANFPAVLWYMNMKNRFGWSDNQQTSSGATININLTKNQFEIINGNYSQDNDSVKMIDSEEKK